MRRLREPGPEARGRPASRLGGRSDPDIAALFVEANR